jgi:uncharacterized membrane protein
LSTQSKTFLTPFTSNFRHKQQPLETNQQVDHSSLLYSNLNNTTTSNSNPLNASFLIPQYNKESTTPQEPKCVTSTPHHNPSGPSSSGFVSNLGCDDLSDFCNLFDAPPSLTVSPDSVFSKSESVCSSSNLDYSYDFGDQKTAGDAIFNGPLEDPQDWSPLFEAPTSQAETPASSSVTQSPPLMIRTFHSTERRSAIVVNNNNKVSKPSPNFSSKKLSPVAQAPIVVSDASDSSAIRRARNTEAARRSRAKKNEKIQELEALVAELMNQNESLQAELRVYRRLSE